MGLNVHRAALFDKDGRAQLWNAPVWAGEGWKLPVFGPVSTPDLGQLYTRSMDDDLDHWHRLHAELSCKWDPDVPEEVRAHLSDSYLVHAGGTPHPKWPHLQIGGTLAWTKGEHPHVALMAARFRAMTPEEHVVTFAGRQFWEEHKHH